MCFYFRSGLQWRKRRWGPFAIVGIKNLKKFNLELSVFSHNNPVIYIVAWFYGTINKAEYLGYDLWAGLGTDHYEQHSFNENLCFQFPAMGFTNPCSEYSTSESWGLPPAQDGWVSQEHHWCQVRAISLVAQWYSFPFEWDTRPQFSITRKSCSRPQRILWELKGPLSSWFLTKVSSLPSHWGNSYVYSFSLALSIFESIFNTSIFLKKCKGFANRNQKTVTAHFFWLTHLVCKWQFLPQEKSFPSHKPLCLPTVRPCQTVRITSFVPHRGNALSVGLTCAERGALNWH